MRYNHRMDYEIELVVDPNLSAAEQEEVRKLFKQAVNKSRAAICALKALRRSCLS